MKSENTSERRLKNSKLSIILPTYIERENVGKIYKALVETIEPLGVQFEIIFVDDNSPDGTIDAVKKLRHKDSRVKYLLMSRRFGDQISLMAGLDVASGDMSIIMDSDLQHPPRYVPEMIKKWLEGYDIVIMKRETEGHHSIFKKWSEIMFYKFLGKFSDTPIYYRFSGFALLDRKTVGSLRRFKESNPFLRGLVGMVGSNIAEIFYKEDEREHGRSKYKLFDMVKLAITGITSFSEAPLYASFYFGTIAVAISLIYAIYVLVTSLMLEQTPPGWASTILVVIFMGGVQLISTGILGIFLSKVFIETKRRPNYIIYESGGFESYSEQ